MDILRTIFGHKIVKFILIFIVGFLTGGVFMESQNRHYETPDWVFINDFDTAEEPDLANKIFNQRVNDEFPEGMDEKMLVKKLRDAGFGMDWYGPINSKTAYFITRDSGCKTDRQVIWSKNTYNKVTSVTGTYWTMCRDKNKKKNSDKSS